MLPPHELKNKKFPLAIRGYAQSDVNDYIDFLIERYTEAYRQNDSLEKELRGVRARLDELEAKEAAINRALVNAQKLQDRIISDAKNEAAIITSAAKQSTARILGEFTDNVRRERAALRVLSESTADFRATMLEEYDKHITVLKAISSDVDDAQWDRSDAEIISEIMKNIRDKAESAVPPEPEKTITGKVTISGSVGEFIGLTDDEEISEPDAKPRKKRPRAARLLKPKQEMSNEPEKPGTDGGDNAEADFKASQPDSDDETLRKLFSEEKE